MSKPHCGECNFFSHESIDGFGWCDVTKREQQCSDQCTMHRENITNKQALRVLHYAQKWRRGAKTECVNPYVFGIAIDRAIKVLRNKNLQDYDIRNLPKSSRHQE